MAFLFTRIMTPSRATWPRSRAWRCNEWARALSLRSLAIIVGVMASHARSIQAKQDKGGEKKPKEKKREASQRGLYLKRHLFI